jgi:hypothetical protein
VLCYYVMLITNSSGVWAATPCTQFGESPPNSARFLLGLLLYLEDRGDMFLRNAWCSPNFALLEPEDCTFHSRRLHYVKCRTLMQTTYLPTYLPAYLWLYSPLLDLGHIFSFLILYTVGRTPWTGISIEQHKHRINAHRHPCLEWNSKPRS